MERLAGHRRESADTLPHRGRSKGANWARSGRHRTRFQAKRVYHRPNQDAYRIYASCATVIVATNCYRHTRPANRPIEGQTMHTAFSAPRINDQKWIERPRRQCTTVCTTRTQSIGLDGDRATGVAANPIAPQAIEILRMNAKYNIRNTDSALDSRALFMPTPDSTEYYAELLNSQLTFDEPETAGRRLPPSSGGDDPPGRLKQSGSESTEAVVRPKPLSINQLLKSSPMSNDKGTKQAPSPSARSATSSSIVSWADEVEMSEDKRQAKEARRALKLAKKEQAKQDRILEAEERRKNGEDPPQPCVNCGDNHWTQDCTATLDPTETAEPAKGKSKKKRKRAAAAAAAAAATESPPGDGESTPAIDEAEPAENDEDSLPEDPPGETLPTGNPNQLMGPPSNPAGVRSSPSPASQNPGPIGRRDIPGASAEDNAGREGARRLSAHAARANYERTTGQAYRGQPTNYPDLSDLKVNSGPSTPSQGTREQNAAYTRDTVTSRDEDVTITGSRSFLDRSRQRLNQFDTANSPAASNASAASAPRSSSKRRLTASATPGNESKKRTVQARGPAQAGSSKSKTPAPSKSTALPTPKVNMTRRKEDTKEPSGPRTFEAVVGATRYSEGRHLYLRLHEDLMEDRPLEAFHPQILKAAVDQGVIARVADWESCQKHDKKGGWVATAQSPEIAERCEGRTFMVNDREVEVLPFQSTNPRAFLAKNTSIFPDTTVATRLRAIQQIPTWVNWWVGRDSYQGSKGSCCIVVFDGPTNIFEFELPLGYHEATNSAFTAHFRAVKTGDKCMICGDIHQGKGTLGCPNLGRMEVPVGQDMPPRTLRDMPGL